MLALGVIPIAFAAETEATDSTDPTETIIPTETTIPVETTVSTEPATETTESTEPSETTAATEETTAPTETTEPPVMFMANSGIATIAEAEINGAPNAFANLTLPSGGIDIPAQGYMQHKTVLPLYSLYLKNQTGYANNYYVAYCIEPGVELANSGGHDGTAYTVNDMVDGSGALYRINRDQVEAIGIALLYETTQSIDRLYNYVNHDKFRDLPVIGTNGQPYTEEIINLDPDVIVMSAYASVEADDLQTKTGTPVVVVPGSDTTLDDAAYETIRIMGQLYGMENRATELTNYLKGIQKDLDDRTKDIPDSEKPSVYVAGVSFKGAHGFEGTESYYGPFELIHANNLANTTGQTGAFDIDLEQVLSWDPEIIFLDFNGMDLINEDYATNPDYYNSLTAVQEGRVYSQISFRSSASNLETALADAYYAACILYPEQFKDVDPVAKAGEIFEMLLGTNPYDDLKEAGYEFRPIKIGEE